MNKFVIFFCLLLVLLFITYKNLLLNLQTHLPDWLDYPYVVWVTSQNIQKFQSMDFSNFFDTNAFHPHPYSLLFSDMLLPQSFIGFLISFFTKNIILIFNLTFFITLVFNYFFSFIFWGKIFKSSAVAFLGSVFFFFSPYFHIQKSHFQMLFYWPTFLVLFLLIKNKNPRFFILVTVGILLTIQFLGSVYISLYLITSIILLFVANSINSQFVWRNLRSLAVIFLTFVVTSGFFIKGYFDMKVYYQIERPMQEFIQYSAHLTDYVFTTPINSILHNSKIMDLWNSFDKNYIGGKASFPGFLLFVTSVLSLFVFTFGKKIKFSLIIERPSLFFFLTALCGFLFSLGPRLNINGTYAHIPLPYYLFLKFVPLFEAVRAPSRWSFLFYLAIVYFSLLFIKRCINKFKTKYVLAPILFLFFIEYVPFGLEAHAESYLQESHTKLLELCKTEPLVVLEVPITHFDGRGGIVNGLNNVTKTLLASTHHKCNLINGYSGYDLPSLISFKNEFYNVLNSKDSEKLFKFLVEYKIDILKVNVNQMDEFSLSNYRNLISSFEKQQGVLELEDDLYRI